MPKLFWDKKQVLGPSAGLVQRHFVEARLEALHRRDKNLEKKIAQVLAEKLKPLKLKGKKWLDVYRTINRNLQQADLTINFDANSWFTTENTYASYAQGYERAGRSATGAARFFSDKLNPADIRTAVDDKITFPQQASSGTAPPRRGLMPGRQGQSRIEAQMRFNPGGLVDVKDAQGNVRKAAPSQNPHFNPKTKQIFAGLNYGRRPKGSTTQYGTSHFVLAQKFKVNAIYFGGDTFYHQDASQQASFNTLGTLVAWAKPILLDAIIKSCYYGNRLKDTAKAELLIEGHIFSELPFTGNITTIYLDAPAYSEVHRNARKFARKHGAKLVVG